jgi:ABC-type multidrug transport system fused ATPase/permease subunit
LKTLFFFSNKGKTSLLNALLGEIQKCSGNVQIRGKLAYVSQQAWLQDSTFQENVLFGHEFRPEDYNAILKACQLEEDIRSLSKGDQTVIGERGTSLSGGQRQRLCLARAAYTNADVYLLDDSLSALDAHVGRDVFDQLIGPKGLLRRSARVLVTHRLSILPHAHHILVLSEGRVVESGSYDQLLARRGQFARFLLSQLETSSQNGLLLNGDEDVEELENIRKILECTAQMPIQSHDANRPNPPANPTTNPTNPTNPTESVSTSYQSISTLNQTHPSSSSSLSSQSTLTTNLTVNSNANPLEFRRTTTKYKDNLSALPTPEPFRRFCEEGAFARESDRSRASIRSLLAGNTIGRRSISSLTEAAGVGGVEDDEYNESCAHPDLEDAEEEQMNKTLRKSACLRRQDEWLSASKMQDNPEHIRVGRIPGRVLAGYVKELRLSQLVLTISLFLMAYFCSMYASLWLSAWSSDGLLSCSQVTPSSVSSNRTQISSSSNIVDCSNTLSMEKLFKLFLLEKPEIIPGNWIRLISYAMIGLFECALILVANLRLGDRIQEAATAVFERMLFGLFDTPLHVLESIPIGRLLTRFSRDQDVLDFIIWLNGRATIQNGLKASVAIFLVMRQSWFLLPAILPLLVFYFGMRSFFLRSRRQLTRLQLAARAPAQSWLMDTLTGASSVRAFKAEPRFEQMFAERVDESNELQIPSQLSGRWLTIRLELIGNLLVVVAVLAALSNNNPEQASIAALAVTSALTVTNTMSLLVRVSSETEANMLSVERCLDYTRFPSEVRSSVTGCKSKFN